MSSDEEPEVSSTLAPTKKRRVQRACDMCRLKKRACDGLRRSEKKCSKCVEEGHECSFSGPLTKRRSYVDILEARLEQTEQLLRKLSPAAPIPKRRIPAPSAPPPGPGVELTAFAIRAMNAPAPAPDSDDLAHLALAQDMTYLTMNSTRQSFHGQSSGAMLVKAAVRMREGAEGREMPWSSRRMHYWTYSPTANRLPPADNKPFEFPHPSLLAELTSLYFTHINIYYPTLHQPTFLASLAANLHKTDRAFGAVALLVCAIGARFHPSASVVSASAEPDRDPLRAGFAYFDQIPLTLPHLYATPSVWNLQYYALASIFLQYSTPAACWTLTGLGIRLAQDVGAHRARPGGRWRSTLGRNREGGKEKEQEEREEGELWTRGFWVLVCLDRLFSAGFGRPCTMQYEDFDVELPIECDDAYWAPSPSSAVRGRRAFEQPAGKPSAIAFFNCYIRLNNLLAFSLKMLYSLSKAKDLLAIRDPQWEEHIVAELDSALNGWVDGIPGHLRWDPNRRDPTFFDQSAFLYCSYYQVQMTIHRALIPMPARGPGPISPLPSLAICTNAARACAHVADISKLRKGGVPTPELLTSVFTSGIVLLLAVWSGKRAPSAAVAEMNSRNSHSTIAEVHKCMASIRVCEERWQSAALFWDLLYELAAVGQLPLPQASPPPPPADTGVDNIGSSQNSAGPSADYAPYVPTPTPAPHMPVPEPLPGVVQQQTQWLPTYTADLGRLMMYNYNPYVPPPLDVPDVVGGSSSSSSTWYPEQTSTAPLGYPDFTVAGGGEAAPLALGEGGYAYAGGYDPGHGMATSADADALLGGDAMAMWANAPMGIEAEDWETYFSAMSELNQALVDTAHDVGSGSGSAGDGLR